MAIEGMPRNTSTHAAGVVITSRPVSDYVPLAKNDDLVVTQYIMTTLEELGLLKMDFLGLRNLTVLDDAVKLVRRKEPDFDIHNIPEDDEATFRMISEGRTSGVFQMESSGMTGVCVGLKPHSCLLYTSSTGQALPRALTPLWSLPWAPASAAAWFGAASSTSVTAAPAWRQTT